MKTWELEATDGLMEIRLNSTMWLSLAGRKQVTKAERTHLRIHYRASGCRKRLT